MTLIEVRAMSISSSTARIMATPASPGRLKAAQPAAMMTRAARGTPATPLDVIMKVSIIRSSVGSDSWIPAA